MRTILFVPLFFFCNLVAPAGAAKPEIILRVGHFPNITHAQALVAHNFSRQGKGWFEQRLGPGVKIEWFVYNAGPSAIEAFFAKSIDLTYVGPNPAINGYVRSKGSEVRVIAGAARGGAALVIQETSPIQKPADFRGKKIATPQFGNTQDVSCRAWLIKNGIKVTRTGGDAQVIPTANPDQILLFKKGTLDGVWTVEPWVSRLELEAGGKVFFEEKESLTTVLACRVDFLQKNRELVKKLVQANAELTQWMKQHPEEAQKMVTAELTELTKRPMSLELTKHAWGRINFSSEIDKASFNRFFTEARQVGFLQEAGNLDHLVEVPQ